MSLSLLPSPPRLLHRQLRRELWFGTPLLLLSLSNIFLACLLALFLCLTYGIGLSSLRANFQETLRVSSQIHEVGWKPLPSGGSVGMVSAQVMINEKVLTVYGYGPATESAKVGDPVDILIPKRQTGQARLGGFHSHPVEASQIFFLALLFAIPGLGLGLLSFARSFRRQKLLIWGEVKLGRKTKTLPLPRPLKDKDLVRWEYESPKGPKTFWCLQDKAAGTSELLFYRNSAAALHSLLSEIELEHGKVKSGAQLGKLYLRCNLIALSGTLSLLLLFLFT